MLPESKDEIMAILRAGGVQELVDWDSIDRWGLGGAAGERGRGRVGKGVGGAG